LSFKIEIPNVWAVHSIPSVIIQEKEKLNFYILLLSCFTKIVNVFLLHISLKSMASLQNIVFERRFKMNKSGKILIASVALIVVVVAILAVLGVFRSVSAARAGPTCTDSDGGIDYFVKGLCSGTNGNFWDYCTGNTCNEYYCNSKKKCVTSPMSCVNLSGSDGTCYDGACQRLPENNCTDSDGGIVYNVKGTCTDDVGSYTDYCTGNVCNEYYCDAQKTCSLTEMDCSTNQSGTCYDGACIY
jgi:hypothetical protein